MGPVRRTQCVRCVTEKKIKTRFVTKCDESPMFGRIIFEWKSASRKSLARHNVGVSRLTHAFLITHRFVIIAVGVVVVIIASDTNFLSPNGTRREKIDKMRHLSLLDQCDSCPLIVSLMPLEWIKKKKRNIMDCMTMPKYRNTTNKISHRLRMCDAAIGGSK